MSNTFWGLTLLPNEKKDFEIPENFYCIMSNVCLGDLEKKDLNKSSTLYIHTKTVYLELMRNDDEDAPENKATSTITKLTFGQLEHKSINYMFSPMTTLQFEVKGDLPINVSGYYSYIENEEEDIDFEEEE